MMEMGDGMMGKEASSDFGDRYKYTMLLLHTHSLFLFLFPECANVMIHCFSILCR